MLSKLLKNEFKATGHYLGTIYLVTAIITGVSVLSIFAKSDTLSVVSCLLLMVIALAFTIVTTLVLFISFFKTLYGDQGYLTFTLPVKTRDLLFSKYFAAFCWFMMSYVVTVALLVWSSYLIVRSAEQSIQNSASGPQLQALLDLIKMFLDLPNKGAAITFLAIVVVQIFAACLVVVSVLFMAISIGNTRLFQKHNIIFSLVFTLVVGWLCAQATKLGNFYPISANLTNEGLEFLVNKDATAFDLFGLEMFIDVNLTTIAVMIVLIAVMWMLTNYIMKRKINVK